LSAKASSTRIVIAADDNPHNLQLLEAILESQGYTFFGVPSGEECLALAARIVPRLFILDIDMPEMDGFETCRRLRANAPHPGRRAHRPRRRSLRPASGSGQSPGR